MTAVSTICHTPYLLQSNWPNPKVDWQILIKTIVTVGLHSTHVKYVTEANDYTLHITHTTHYTYYTLHILHITHITHYTYYTLHILHITHTTHYTYYTLHYDLIEKAGKRRRPLLTFKHKKRSEFFKRAMSQHPKCK